jgi:ankyrin repeat protein
MSSPFRRALPAQPDLDQQRKQAKELVRDWRAGHPDAVARMRAALPDKPFLTLADAQFVLAREYGFATWAALTAHIEAIELARSSPLEQVRRTLRKGDVASLRRLLTHSAELRAMIDQPVCPFDAPPLVYFASHEDPAAVELLLEFGADPNARSQWWAGGFHALHSASPAAAERLLAAGAVPDACAAAHLDRADLLARMLAADPSRVHERGGDGQTPLHFARSRKVVDLLLDGGADLDARDVDHRATPAQWMLQGRKGAGRYDLARYLVERGAATDIFLACALGLTDRVRELAADDPSVLGLRTNHPPYGEEPPSSFHIYTWTIGQRRTPIEVAAQFEQGETLTALRELLSPRQRFIAACTLADETDARAMLREHPELMRQLDAIDHQALPAAAWSSDVAAVELMLALGFPLDTLGQDNGTALHCAAWQGSVACVTALLCHPGGPALLDRRDSTHGGTPLAWCCHGSQNSGNPTGDHAAVARLLLDAGSPIDLEPGDATDEVEEVIEAWRPGRAGR